MIRSVLVVLGALFAFAATPAAAQQRAPLDWFYGYDQYRGAAMSPSGRYLAVIQRDAVGDVLTIVDLDTRSAQGIQRARTDQSLQLGEVWFASDDRVVFRLIQRNRVEFTRSSALRRASVDDGFETNTRIYSSNIDGTELVQLYDPTAQGFDRYLDASIVSTLPKDDDHVLLIVPTRGGAELRKVNVRTAQAERIDTGTIHTGGWVVDVNGTPVLRIDSVGNGRGYAWLRRGPEQRSWTEITRYRGAQGVNTAPPFRPLAAAVQPGRIFVALRRDGQDTMGVYILDTNTGEYVETLQTNQAFDVTDAVIDERRNIILAACWLGHRRTCEPKNAEFAERWTSINTALGQNSEAVFLDSSEDGDRWFLFTYGPQDLGTYYVYTHSTSSLNVAFRQRPDSNPALLPTERVVEYTASDGQRLWGYLWLPPGTANARNLPTIVVPHGGPEGRDAWGGGFLAHAFASQGYAVFQPHFRGGAGSGRAFVEAGHGQFGRRMQADVTDGTRYLIEQGIADASRICIAGWSYGGYVAFTASFLNTDLFKCSVAGAGISDLRAMLRWVRSGSTENDVSGGGASGQQSMSFQYWSQAIGDQGDSSLDQYSAAQNADRVTIPLLIIHGDEDTTVPIEQSELMQRAMQRAGKETRLIVLEDVSHSPSPLQGDAMRTVLTESVAFFNQHIGPGVAPSGEAQ